MIRVVDLLALYCEELMSNETNSLGQPIGLPVLGWSGRAVPSDDFREGRFCRLERLTPDRHARDLYEANSIDTEGACWTYLPYGPFTSFDEYRLWLLHVAGASDPLFFAIIDRTTGRAVGVCSYLRIDPANGVIEVGHLNFSPLLRSQPAATEAMYLMMKSIFEMGYRRYEWKCDALNGPSRRAAQRLGFSFEGIFRQAVVVKGRNRDTAWYSVIDQEWPALNQAFTTWLDPRNFDAVGKQNTALSALTFDLVANRG